MDKDIKPIQQALPMSNDNLDNKSTIHINSHHQAEFVNSHLYEELQRDKTDCLQVGFCLGIPEVYRLLIKDGFKSPKISRNN